MARKNVFRGFNEIRTRGLCVRAAVLYQLSDMNTHKLEAGQFIELINPWKEWNKEWNDDNFFLLHEFLDLFVNFQEANQITRTCKNRDGAVNSSLFAFRQGVLPESIP